MLMWESKKRHYKSTFSKNTHINKQINSHMSRNSVHFLNSYWFSLNYCTFVRETHYNEYGIEKWKFRDFLLSLFSYTAITWKKIIVFASESKIIQCISTYVRYNAQKNLIFKILFILWNKVTLLYYLMYIQ